MRIAIVGNSGSGKSTLARWLSTGTDLRALDLDTIAWEPGKIAVPRPPEAALADVARFCNTHPAWVIEGCYGRLIGGALDFKPILIFADPGIACCIAHCKQRPFEAHKYASKAEQDDKLAFLLDWVASYERRDGEMARQAHAGLFEEYAGPKLHLRAPVPTAEVLWASIAALRDAA